MKRVVLSIGIMIAMLCAPFVPAFSQDSTRQQEEKKVEMKMEEMENKMEEIARKLEEMVEKLDTKVRKEVEGELVGELKKVLKELEQELEGIGEEIEREMGEMEEEMEEEIEEREEHGKMEKEIEEEVREGYGLGDVIDGLEIKFNKQKDKLKNVKTRWLLADLGFASYISPDPLPEINGINPMEIDLINSVSWRLHIFNQRINLIRHHMNLVYGAGFSFNFYGFSNPATLLPSQPEVTFTLEDNTDFSFKKNHLRASYIHIPLMLNFETNPTQKSKSFHFNAGVYGDILMGGKTSQKTNNRKIKIKNKFNLENFQYGLIGNIGYGPVTFYGSYGLNELFKPEKDNGYTVNPITFGLRILPF